MCEVWRKIVTTVCANIPGLVWGQTYLVEPVAFGVNKLIMTCTIEDKLVLLADITDPIEQNMKRSVQSVQVVAMTKLPTYEGSVEKRDEIGNEVYFRGLI